LVSRGQTRFASAKSALTGSDWPGFPPPSSRLSF
jgi:hypothetical protein